jgi:CheY-like chemotaxis protein
MSLSIIYRVGQTRAPRAGEHTHINFGDVPCHQVIHSRESRAVLVPKPFEYLLQGRNGLPWHVMPQDWQEQRFHDLCQTGWAMADYISRLIKQGVSTQISSSRIGFLNPGSIESLAGLPADVSQERDALGEKLIRSGSLARVTLAAGEAARFKNANDPRPKALIEISDAPPLEQETYLSVQARDILLAQHLYETRIPWLLFVHPAYRQAFEAYLDKNNYFELDPDNIIFTEHTGFVPKFTSQGKIATMADLDGEDPNNEKIAFGTSGHGFFATAFKENPVIIKGRRREGTTPYDELKARGIHYLFQSNIDNLGARISSMDYKVILGTFCERAKEGVQILIELTTPLIVSRPDSTRFFWDEGGVALKVDGIPGIVDGNALEGDVRKMTRDPQNPFPFNTANATYGIETIPPGAVLSPTIQYRKGSCLFETNFWSLPGKTVTPGFVDVLREIPEALAVLPPIKGESAGKLSHPKPLNGQQTPSNRFIPTKEFPHRDHAASLYAQAVLPVLNAVLAEKKATSRLLIVEDSPSFRGEVVKTLQGEGWQLIEEAGNFAEAEQKLRTATFDFVVLDAILKPGAEEATEAQGVKLLKDQKLVAGTPNHDTPFLFWSSFDSEEAFHGLSQADAFMMKGVVAGRKGDYTGPNTLSDLIIQHLLGR